MARTPASSVVSVEIFESDVVVGEHTIRVNRAGRAGPAERTLVFLHGSGPGVTARSNWEGALERLSDQFDCLAPDVLGFGNSTHPDPAPVGMRAFTKARVESVLSLLDVLGCEQVELVGNSMGGLIAMEVARAAPDRVGRMTLMGSGGVAFKPGPHLLQLLTFYDDPSAESLESLMRSFLHDPAAFGDVAELSRTRLDLAVRSDIRRSHLATFAEGSYALTDAEIAGISHKVQLIHGREDRIIPLEASLHLHSLIEHSSLHVMGECGHWSQLEQPEAFDFLIRGFHGRSGL